MHNLLALQGLVNAGANIVVDARQVEVLSLQGLVSAAARSGATVHIKNAGELNQLTLMALAGAAKSKPGSVILDFCE